VTDGLRGSVVLAVLFALGFAAGVWVAVSPWALGHAPAGDWTPTVWSGVVVGAVLVLASATSLVVVLARAVHVALRRQPPPDAG
jgi:hypothetical protein